MRKAISDFFLSLGLNPNYVFIGAEYYLNTVCYLYEHKTTKTIRSVRRYE